MTQAGGLALHWADTGVQTGTLRLGEAAMPILTLLGGEWPSAPRWEGAIQPLTLGGRALLRVSLRAEGGDDDLRVEVVRAALLPDPPTSLQPLWVGEVERATTELDACTLEVRAELRVDGGTLVVRRVGDADWQPPSEEENSQTPSFTALKATCKAPAAVEERHPLPEGP